MHPLSDKDLDRLSREAAEQYDVEQNTSGWEKLEQKLNKQLPEKGKRDRRRFLFFIWLLALLSGGGLLWILTGTHSSRMITLKEGSSEISVPKSTDEAIDHQTPEKETKKEDHLPNTKALSRSLTGDNPERPTNATPGAGKTTSEKISAKEGTVIIPEKTTTLKAPASKNPTAVNNKKNSRSVEMKTQGNVVVSSGRRKDNVPGPAITSTSPGPAPGERTEKDNTSNPVSTSDNNFKKDIFSPEQDQPKTNDNKPIIDSAAAKSERDSTSIVKKLADSKKTPGFQKGFQISVVAAPDMSNVKFTNTDKVGYNVGLQLGYRLSQRWIVTTGVIYTKKNYTSRGKDFNPPKGSWLDNVRLDLVEGNCSMFDIPLNVRYDLNNSKSHRYFLNTGLSSYLMKKEEYHYHYQYSNGNPGYRYRSASSSEQHWLSVLNISAGFEKKLGNRFSLQAEPYLKIPLSGVGYGNLQLNSYGMYFSLKFHTNKR